MDLDILEDKRIILTLDAGGTNFVFSAMQAGEEIIEPVHLPASAKDLNEIIHTIINGFEKVSVLLKEKPAAISFAFPGPADYPRGIIGDLANLPSFRGGVALKPMLEYKFQIPVFVNNDGNLFAYGEAISGFLPEINNSLKSNGNIKQYNNLFGLSLGTGFGGGAVFNKELFIGDNSNASEIWCLRDYNSRESYIEESLSIRAIVREYYNKLGHEAPDEAVITPKEISSIARNGNGQEKEAAIYSFNCFGRALGEAIANIVTIIDGVITIGGGISNAYDLFIPACMQVINGSMKTYQGEEIPRLPVKFYNIEDVESYSSFLSGMQKTINVPLTDKKIVYDEEKRIPIGKTVLGTNKACAVGAYAFALKQLNKQ